MAIFAENLSSYCQQLSLLRFLPNLFWRLSILRLVTVAHTLVFQIPCEKVFGPPNTSLEGFLGVPTPPQKVFGGFWSRVFPDTKQTTNVEGRLPAAGSPQKKTTHACDHCRKVCCQDLIDAQGADTWNYKVVKGGGFQGLGVP